MDTSSLNTMLFTIFPETFCAVPVDYRSADVSYLYITLCIIDSSLYCSLLIWVMYPQTMCCPLAHLSFIWIPLCYAVIHYEARSEAHYPHRLSSSPTLLHRDRHPPKSTQYLSIASTRKTNPHIRSLLLLVTAPTRTRGCLPCMPLTSIPQVAL